MTTISSSPATSKLVIIAAIIYLTVFFALGSGAFNAIIEGGGGGSQAFILPSRSAQTPLETVVTALLLFIGMGGAFLLYRAGKATTSKSQMALLASGFAIIGIPLILGFTLINLKS